MQKTQRALPVVQSKASK